MRSMMGLLSFLLLCATYTSAIPIEETAALEARQTLLENGTCAQGVHIIAAGGDGAWGKAYGNIGTTVAAIIAAVPGSDGVSLPWPKSSTHGMRATTKGRVNMIRYLNNYHKACPNTKVVLAGYSGGAIITMNAVCGASEWPWHNSTPLAAKWTNTVIAVIAYGDETYVADAPWNRGTCPVESPNNNSSFPRTNLAGCAAFADRLLDFCDAGDPRCCSGLYPPDHFNYFDRYDYEVGQYVAGKFNGTL